MNRIENHFCGMLVIYKEAGFTSSDVISKLRGILHMKRLGHTGTLDPQAEGVLPVCLGNGTKVAELIADHDKEYVCRMRLGVTTDTQDMTGTVLSEMGEDEICRLLLNGSCAGSERNAAALRGGEAESASAADEQPEPTEDLNPAIREHIASCIRSFQGEILQIPPMYSAVWSNGRRLYELAREGKTVDRQARRVRIEEIEVQDIDLPYVTFRVVCSKGTYVRTLCEDIGRKLGTGAAMDHLLRTRVGIFTLDEAVKLDELQRMTDDDLLMAGILPDMTRARFPEDEKARIRDRLDSPAMRQEELVPEYSEAAAARASGIRWSVGDHIIPIDSLFMGDPAVHIRAEDSFYLYNGNALSGANTVEGEIPHTDRIRVYDEKGNFFALYRYVAERGRIQPLKMFHDTASVKTDRHAAGN